MRLYSKLLNKKTHTIRETPLPCMLKAVHLVHGEASANKMYVYGCEGTGFN